MIRYDLRVEEYRTVWVDVSVDHGHSFSVRLYVPLLFGIISPLVLRLETKLVVIEVQDCSS